MKKNLASVLCLGALALGGTAYAMPTQAELEKARVEVARALEAKRGDYVKKRITGEALADYALGLLPDVGNEAERFLLYRDAILFYARAAAYDKAVDAAEQLLKDVKDVPDETFLALLRDALVKSRKEGGALAAFYEARREQNVRVKKVAEAKAAYDKTPHDPVVRTLYAEALALAGRWKDALPVFVQAGGPVGKMAQAELDGFKGGVTRRAAGDFWWGYVVAGESGDKSNGIKRHAAELYEQAISTGEVKGLAARNLETRIDKVLSRKAGAYDWRVPAGLKKPKFLSFNLDGGRTMEFVACPAGTFDMSGLKNEGTHQVTLTRPFWMARFNVTTAEWREFAPDSRTVYEPYEKAFANGRDMALYVRARVPEIKAYCAFLNRKYARLLPRDWVFRLPTEAEFEYAMKLGGMPLRKLRIAEQGMVAHFQSKGFFLDFPRGTALQVQSIDKSPMAHRLFASWHFTEGDGKCRAENAWGIFDLAPATTSIIVLDTLATPRNVAPSGWGQEDVLGLLKYEKQAFDPLRIAIPGKDEKLWVVSRKGTDRRIAVTEDFADWSYAIRLVVGPDIEKITREKLAAAKK